MKSTLFSAWLLCLLVCTTTLEGSTRNKNYKSDKWDTKTVMNADGTKDVIKWRFTNWHSIKNPMSSKKISKIRTYDKCEIMIRKRKLVTIEGCFGGTTITKSDKHYKSKCKNI